MFRLSGKEIENSIYFTLYALKEIANSFKDISPYHLAINYDRTKVASKVYKESREKIAGENINLHIVQYINHMDDFSES
jgi:hypothetical protein